jgi:heat shock protein HtpX
MADTSSPVLAYNRIDVNRRNTRLLLAAFAALLLPFAFGLAQILPSAYVSAQVLILILLKERAVFPEVTATEIVSLTTMALVAFVAALVFAYAGNALISSFLLWRAGARRAYQDSEPDLFRTVENLCIGAGLQPPTLYIAESTAPNAFTTGCDPEHASLVISRGLLGLLNEREMAAVVAHELSHIGNHDTDFSTMLAALVATVRFPLNVVSGIAWLVTLLKNPEDQERGNQEGQQAVIATGLVVFLVVMNAGLANLFAVEWNLQVIVAVASPIYVLVLAPACATLLLRTMSQQRDFHADADAALLTRDPEGVALALAKVSGALPLARSADTATAHLYFVDPLPRASWQHGGYRSHPSIASRIALLARMGDGIPEGELRNAAEAGEKFRQNTPLVEAAPRPTSPRIEGRGGASCEPGSQARLTDSRSLLYEAADMSSGVLAELDSNVLLTIENLEPQFIRVRLVDGTVGYIRLFAGLMSLDDDPQHDPGLGALELDGIHHTGRTSDLMVDAPVPETPFRLPGSKFRLTGKVTPLYAKPDGWSDVVQQLTSGTTVTFYELVGTFARVATERTAGYISSSTHAVRTDTA